MDTADNQPGPPVLAPPFVRTAKRVVLTAFSHPTLQDHGLAPHERGPTAELMSGGRSHHARRFTGSAGLTWNRTGRLHSGEVSALRAGL